MGGGGALNKREAGWGVGFLLFLRLKFGYLLQNHIQNKFSLLFLEILTNTNTNKCCQMFLTFLKRY